MPPDTEEVRMRHLYQEVGRTVRAAMLGWPETFRLCVILIAATILITVYRLL
jgi:hypothetical protein